jgi:tRNA pseudouridine38-40 synthase
LAYDGTGCHGWAIQPGLRTVEGEFSAALERIVRRPVGLSVAGRTDAGVHARGQVAHLDLSEPELLSLNGRQGSSPNAETLVRRLNAVLPNDLRVLRGELVPESFDARFSALWRRYRYRVADQTVAQDPLRRTQTWWTRPLDVEAMSQAAEPLTGEHDFAAYCVPRQGASTVRTLYELRAERVGPGRIDVWAQAGAFCHHMVRFLVGALVTVGQGRRPPAWATQVLASGQRDGSVPLAPAHGLTLEQVAYPAGAAALAAQATKARNGRPSA